MSNKEPAHATSSQSRLLPVSAVGAMARRLLFQAMDGGVRFARNWTSRTATRGVFRRTPTVTSYYLTSNFCHSELCGGNCLLLVEHVGW